MVWTTRNLLAAAGLVVASAVSCGQSNLPVRPLVAGGPAPAPPAAPPPRLSFLADRDVWLVGQTPFVELHAVGIHRNEMGPLVTRFEVLSPTGLRAPEPCEPLRRPRTWTLWGTATLSFECHGFREPGVSTVRVDPAVLGLGGPVVEVPIRHVREPLPARPTGPGWVAIPLESQTANPDCEALRLPDGKQPYIATVKADTVELGHGKPVALALPDALRAEASMDALPAATAVIQVRDGWIVGFDRGEFGGGLFWYARDGLTRRALAVGPRGTVQNVRKAMLIDGKVYALQGLSHGVGTEGHLAEIWQERGEWHTRVLAMFPTAPFDWVFDAEDGSWLVATEVDVSRVTREGEREVVARVPWWSRRDSLVRGPDGTLYVGALAGVVRLTPTWPEAPRYRAEYLVPAGSRQEACFQPLAMGP